MKKEELPKLPHGQGTFGYKRDKIEYKKMIELPNGKKVRKSVVGDSVKECMKKMDNLVKELVRSEKKANNQTLINAMDDWADNVKKPTLKTQSYDRLKCTIRNQIGNYPIAHERYQMVSTREIQEFIQSLVDRSYAQSTIKKVFNALNDFYRYKSIVDKIDNPMLLVAMPTRNNIKAETKKIVFFEQDDIEKFILEAHTNWKSGAPKYRYGLMLAANIYLGIRIGELIALSWKDIDFESNTIYICKTVISRRIQKTDGSFGLEKVIQNSTKKDKTRYVPINSKAKKLILEYMDTIGNINSEDFVFATKKGTFTDITIIQDTLKRMTQNANMKVITSSTHALRHTCASLYFRAGVPIETICQILGNTREVCEKTYVHFVEEQLKEAASKIDIIEI